jgi:hypothetical protein
MKIIDHPQYSDPWWLCRNGKPSASNAKKLITSTGAPSKSASDYSKYLAGCMFAGCDIDAIDPTIWMQRGTDTEEEARNYYSFLKGVQVDEVGSFTDDMEQYIASPDGVITAENGLLEIKVLKPVNHISAIMYCKKNQRPPPLYVPQCQMSLFVSGMDWLDLTFYNVDLPKVVIRILPDEKVVAGLKAQLLACLAARNLVLTELKSF